jgi:hypothetical protein
MFGEEGDTLGRMVRDDNALMSHYAELGLAMAEDRDDRETIAEIWKKIETRRAEIIDAHNESYPADPPNSDCYHALITGVLIENGTLPRKGDYRYLMSWGLEKIYLWTHTANSETGLVSEVGVSIKEQNVWKSFASSIRIAIGLASVLETSLEVEYHWIYRFDPANDLQKQDFQNKSRHTGLGMSVIKKIRDIYLMSPILELLDRSESFFVAAQNVIALQKIMSFVRSAHSGLPNIGLITTTSLLGGHTPLCFLKWRLQSYKQQEPSRHCLASLEIEILMPNFSGY